VVPKWLLPYINPLSENLKIWYELKIYFCGADFFLDRNYLPDLSYLQDHGYGYPEKHFGASLIYRPTEATQVDIISVAFDDLCA